MAPAITIALCVCSFNLSSCDSQHFGLNNHEIWLSRRWFKLAHFTFQLVKAKTKLLWLSWQGRRCMGLPRSMCFDSPPPQDEFGGLWSSLHWCCIPGACGFWSPSLCGREHHPEHLCYQLCLLITFVATKHIVQKQTRVEILYPSTESVCVDFLVAGAPGMPSSSFSNPCFEEVEYICGGFISF